MKTFEFVAPIIRVSSPTDEFGSPKTNNKGVVIQARLTVAASSVGDKINAYLAKYTTAKGKPVSHVGVRPDGNYAIDLTGPQCQFLAESTGAKSWEGLCPFLQGAEYACLVILREEGDVYAVRGGEDGVNTSTYAVHEQASIVLDSAAKRDLAIAIMSSSESRKARTYFGTKTSSLISFEDDADLANDAPLGDVADIADVDVADDAPLKVVNAPVGKDGKPLTPTARAKAIAKLEKQMAEIGQGEEYNELQAELDALQG